MNKYTFVLDVVTDGELDTDSIAQTLIANVENDGVYAAIKPVKTLALKEQGFKVWRARVAGVTEESLNPKPPKKAKAVKAEAAVEVAAS
jgi:hypothetical protein